MKFYATNIVTTTLSINTGLYRMLDSAVVSGISDMTKIRSSHPVTAYFLYQNMLCTCVRTVINLNYPRCVTLKDCSHNGMLCIDHCVIDNTIISGMYVC